MHPKPLEIQWYLRRSKHFFKNQWISNGFWCTLEASDQNCFFYLFVLESGRKNAWKTIGFSRGSELRNKNITFISSNLTRMLTFSIHHDHPFGRPFKKHCFFNGFWSISAQGYQEIAFCDFVTFYTVFKKMKNHWVSMIFLCAFDKN